MNKMKQRSNTAFSQPNRLSDRNPDSHLEKKKEKKRRSIICFNESPLKMMKNVFYFILKALFVLKIFTFIYFLVMLKKRLDQKDKVNFKIHDVTT